MSSQVTGGRKTPINRVRERAKRKFDRVNEMEPHHRQLDSLFEKLYFHEIEGRDKAYQRLQLPLVSFVALLGFVGSLLQNIRREDTSPSATIFWILMGIAVLALIGASVFLIASVIGKRYKYLPVPKSWKEYHAKCFKTYNDFDEAGELIEAALHKNLVAAYEECATFNGAVNEKRSYHLFMLLRCLLIAAMMTFAAFCVFYFGKLEKRPVKDVQPVEITNPITLKGAQMANEKVPPPPPPPPPMREIREDRPPHHHSPQPVKPN